MMKQNAVPFQGVLRKLEAWQNPKIESCERRAIRYPVRCEARLTGDSDDTTTETAEQHVQIRDISRTGAGLLCDRPIATGTRWRLQPAVEGMAIAGMTVFCRYCRAAEPGVYLVGVEFGIEAATLIALGVPTAQLNHDEAGDADDKLTNCQFVDPSELIKKDVG